MNEEAKNCVYKTRIVRSIQITWIVEIMSEDKKHLIVEIQS